MLLDNFPGHRRELGYPTRLSYFDSCDDVAGSANGRVGQKRLAAVIPLNLVHYTGIRARQTVFLKVHSTLY